jgi:hypothetical protein
MVFLYCILVNKPHSCVVPHGGKNSLSGTPGAIVPLPESPVPEWLRKMVNQKDK